MGLSKEDREAIKKYGGRTLIDGQEERLGVWIYGEFDIPHCSECGHEVMPNKAGEYCPMCHAYMCGEDFSDEEE